MKNFIKENLVLVLGLSIPLLLVVLFFVATVIPKMMGSPPKYEMLFTITKYEYQSRPEYWFDFTVKDGQLMIRAKKNEDKDGNRQVKKLMVYDGKAEAVREIKFDPIKAGEYALGKDAALEEAMGLRVDSSHVSPDGYMLDTPHYHSGGLVGGLFGGGYRNNSNYRLKKGGAVYKIPHVEPYYYYDQFQFLGWIVKE